MDILFIYTYTNIHSLLFTNNAVKMVWGRYVSSNLFYLFVKCKDTVLIVLFYSWKKLLTNSIRAYQFYMMTKNIKHNNIQEYYIISAKIIIPSIVGLI